MHSYMRSYHIYTYMDEKIQKVPMAVDADDRCNFFLNLTLWTSLSSHYRGREWGFMKTGSALRVTIDDTGLGS